MEREQLKGKQTQGTIVFSTSLGYPCLMRDEHPKWNTADVSEGLPNGEEETQANAALYAEAHNVANRTGMWPEDLEQRVKELEEALSRIEDHFEVDGYGPSAWKALALEMAEVARAILNKKPA